MWGQEVTRNDNKVIFPESFGEVKCYNVGCTGWETVVSTNKGIIYIGSQTSLYLNGKQSEEISIKNEKNFNLISLLFLPQQIKHVFCTYNSFHIFDFNGNVISGKESFNFYSKIDLKSVSFLPTFNTRSFQWTKELHKSFPLRFKSMVFCFLLCMKTRSKNIFVPKVLLVEIIKILSKSY